jgi:hypothetical protein
MTESIFKTRNRDSVVVRVVPEAPRPHADHGEWADEIASLLKVMTMRIERIEQKTRDREEADRDRQRRGRRSGVVAIALAATAVVLAAEGAAHPARERAGHLGASSMATGEGDDAVPGLETSSASPYRKGWPREKVHEHLRSLRDAPPDAGVVGTFPGLPSPEVPAR